MKTFITGATGFIGTHLVKRLAQTEHELICLVRKTSDVQTLKELGIPVITGDVTDKDSVLEGMRGCDWVVNLANIYTFWEPDKQVYTDVNVGGTRNVMECALETAELIAANNEYGVWMTKQGLWANLDAPSLRYAMELENRTQVLGTFTDNMMEAFEAFREGREPKWKPL